MYCIECKHFIGAGDFNLCCDLKYNLCYEDTESCELFEQSDSKSIRTRLDYIATYNKGRSQYLENLLLAERLER